MIDDVHGRVLDVVEVETDDGDVDAAGRNSLRNFPGSGISGFGVIDLGVFYVFVLAAFQDPHALVEGHADLGLVQSLGGAGDAYSLV